MGAQHPVLQSSKLPLQIDENEPFLSRSGKVFLVIKKKGISTAPPQYLPVGTSVPFDTLPGYLTSEGVITPPTDPVGGYIQQGRGWILHAARSEDPYYQSYY